MLKKNSTLWCLDLSRNPKVQSFDVFSLMDGLKGNFVLEKLNLCDTAIDSSSLDYITVGLNAQQKELKYFDEKQISAGGRGLLWLDIGGNAINDIKSLRNLIDSLTYKLPDEVKHLVMQRVKDVLDAKKN
jgi:hypothetical protein